MILTDRPLSGARHPAARAGRPGRTAGDQERPWPGANRWYTVLMSLKLAKLSPQARKTYRRATPGEVVRVTVELARGKTPRDLSAASGPGGLQVLSYSDRSRVAQVELAAETLGLLAEDPIVVYVEIGQKLGL